MAGLVLEQVMALRQSIHGYKLRSISFPEIDFYAVEGHSKQITLQELAVIEKEFIHLCMEELCFRSELFVVMLNMV